MMIDAVYLQSAIATLPEPIAPSVREVLNVPEYLSANTPSMDANASFSYYPVIVVAVLYVINDERILRWELEIK